MIRNVHKTWKTFSGNQANAKIITMHPKRRFVRLLRSAADLKDRSKNVVLKYAQVTTINRRVSSNEHKTVEKHCH